MWLWIMEPSLTLWLDGLYIMTQNRQIGFYTAPKQRNRNSGPNAKFLAPSCKKILGLSITIYMSILLCIRNLFTRAFHVKFDHVDVPSKVFDCALGNKIGGQSDSKRQSINLVKRRGLNLYLQLSFL